MLKKIFRIVRHTLLWLFFLGLPFILFLEIFEDQAINVLHYTLASPYYWIFSLSFILLFYANIYYFIPEFYLNKRYGFYAISILLLFIFFYLLKPFDLMFRYYYIQQGREIKPFNFLAMDLFSCVFFIVIITGTMIVQVVKKWQATELRAVKAEAEKANAELSFLKAQINPHFLFNTLNNIYSLSVDKHPDTPASIMKLSNIMRYITDEATQDFVPLEHEISCISDYIDLQRLRHHKNMQVKFSVSGKISEKEIAPLILMTYIENAFKYGISSHRQALITIRIEADDEKIGFFCQNQVFAQPGVSERTGIGQSNTRQRLKHIYPGKHALTISEPDRLYTVELVLFA